MSVRKYSAGHGRPLSLAAKAQRSDEVEFYDQSTKAGLEIFCYFDKDDEVKKIIGQHFKTSGRLRIVEDSIIRNYKNRKTCCTILMDSNKIDDPENLLKTLCQALKTRLQVEVSCPVFITTENSINSAASNTNVTSMNSTTNNTLRNSTVNGTASNTNVNTRNSTANSFSRNSTASNNNIISRNGTTNSTLTNNTGNSTARNNTGNSTANSITINQHQRRTDTHESDRIKQLRERLMLDIKGKSESTLIRHMDKITQFKSKYRLLCETENEDNGSEIEVLREKINELNSQRDVFHFWRSETIKKMQEINPAMASLSELNKLAQSIGIECQRLEAALPMYAKRNDIVNQVSSHQVSIILGETGSGKSTQLVQYLYEAGLANTGQIVCTQPRKVAAITLAERVAKEMVCKVGQLVGYKTGINKKLTKETKIIFSTDHSLLNECLKNQDFNGYSCIIVDEAHERSIYTDLLLGLIKSSLQRRPELKVIITSATIDPEIFVRYFNTTPALPVSGRAFPVDVIYDDTDFGVEFEDYEIKAVSKAVQVHCQEETGDILVFLTSPVEIMRCCEEFGKQMRNKNNVLNFKCFPLHGQLPPDEQRKVFECLHDAGTRKIVFATNCAETSLTIDGIKYVIDTGVAKEVKYNAKKNFGALGTHVISKSSANQRKGRAGRTASGKCYRLYSESGYMSMETSSKPEILRVHLGQAVLKLSALGIDCRQYDFVESPGKDAIEAAVSSLIQLGAMTETGITETGQWINNLPFDPRQGFLIFHGQKENILYDAIVIASLLKSGSNIFYKGITDSDQQNSSKSKTHFGSQDGDVFTWLEVYKDWLKLAKNAQSKWCKNNCINYKMINYVKQDADEIREILRKDAAIRIDEVFADTEKVTQIFKKLIYQAYRPSLSHYLGHQKAGYFALDVEKQVHFHPSSSLVCLNAQPEWIVYTDLTKTSRDFIKGISVVDEALVLEDIRQGKLPFSLEDVKKRKINVVHREEMGSAMFRNFVGPRYSHLRELEVEMTNLGMRTAVVEVDRNLGIIDLYSSSPMNEMIVKELKTFKIEKLKSLECDGDELPVIRDQKGFDSSGFRVVIGQGGMVTMVLMPDENNKVIIRRSNFHKDVQEIESKFQKYGKIIECIKFKKSDPWGLIKFSSKHEAKLAVEATVNDEHEVAELKIENRMKKSASKFELKMSWCRRPIKGNGTAFIKCAAVDRPSIYGKRINVNGRYCDIRMSKKGDDLVCFGTGQADEQDIKDAVLQLVNYDERLEKSLFININRQNVTIALTEELKEIKEVITQEIKSRIKDMTCEFEVKIRTPKPKSNYHVVFVLFYNPQAGLEIYKDMKYSFIIQGQHVEMKPCLSTMIHFPQNIFHKCEDELNEIKTYLTEELKIEVNFREMKYGSFAVEMKSASIEHLVQARDLLLKELDGDIIDCSKSELCKTLFQKEGREELKKMEQELKVLIILDERKETIQIFGPAQKKSETKININKYLDKLEGGERLDILLKGHDKPAGLMKRLIQMYEDLPDGIVKTHKLTYVKIDFKQQRLSVLGPAEAVHQVKKTIEDMEKELWAKHQQLAEKSLPDCVVCMCPVESHQELYRLEGCGHAYCYSCVKSMVSVAVDDKKFPFECASEGCSVPLVWKDIMFCLKKKWINESKMVQRSLDFLVATKPSCYRHCKTANCPTVYEVTEDEQGHEFNCPACLVSVCTSCHANFHNGISCRLLESHQKNDELFEQWRSANKHNCKFCPGCKTAVEKNEGCNKMHCITCHCFFCWLCLEKFSSEQLCYAHLATKHGGFS